MPAQESLAEVNVDPSKKQRKGKPSPAKETNLQNYIDHMLKSRESGESDRRQTLQKGNKAYLLREAPRTDRHTKTSIKTADTVKRSKNKVKLNVAGTDETKFKETEKIKNTPVESRTISIEEFLTTFYPNPYDLEKVNEFRRTKSGKKSTTINGSKLLDVIVSKFKLNQVSDDKSKDAKSTDDIIVHKNVSGNSRVSSSAATTADKKSRNSGSRTKNKDEKYYVNKLLEGFKQSSVSSKVKNQQISLGGSFTKSVLKSKSTESGKSIQGSTQKLKNKKKVPRIKEIQEVGTTSDYDLGKLKNLKSKENTKEMTQGDAEKKKKDEKVEDEDNWLLEVIPDSISYKEGETDDISKIFDVVDKTRDSILLITARNEKEQENQKQTNSGEEAYTINNVLENDSLAQLLNELNINLSQTQTDKESRKSRNGDLSRSESEGQFDTETKVLGGRFSTEKLSRGKGRKKIDRMGEKMKKTKHMVKTILRKLEKESKLNGEELVGVKDEISYESIIKNQKSSIELRRSSTETGMVEKAKYEVEEKVCVDVLELYETSQKIQEVVHFVQKRILNFAGGKRPDEANRELEREANLSQEILRLETLIASGKEDLKDFKRKIKTNEEEEIQKMKEIQMGVNEGGEVIGEEIIESKSLCEKLIQSEIDSITSSLPRSVRKRRRKKGDQLHPPASPHYCDTESVESGTNNSLRASSVTELETLTSDFPEVQTITESDGLLEDHIELECFPDHHQNVEVVLEIQKPGFSILTTDHQSEFERNIFKKRRTEEDQTRPEEGIVASTATNIRGEPIKRGVFGPRPSETYVANGRRNFYDIVGSGSRQTPSFVICVNTLPRNLRTRHPVPLPFTSSVSFSVNHIDQNWNLKEVDNPSMIVNSFTLPPCKTSVVSIHRASEEVAFVEQKWRTTRLERIFLLMFMFEVAQEKENYIYRNSESYICVRQPPPTSIVEECKFLFRDIYQTSVWKDLKRYQSMELGESLSNSNFKTFSDSDHSSRDGDGEKASLIPLIGTTTTGSDERMLLLQQQQESLENLCPSCDILSNSSRSEGTVLKADPSDLESCGDTKKRIQELLLRTYNLQNKLKYYLKKMNVAQPGSFTCPFIRQQTYDFEILDETETEVLEEDPSGEKSIIQMHDNGDNCSISYLRVQPYTSKEQLLKNKTKVEILQEVTKIDQTTSYHLQEEIKKESILVGSKKEENSQKHCKIKEEEDRSSISSFKSSNSEDKGNEKSVKSDSSFDFSKLKSMQFVKKICKEVENFRNLAKSKPVEEKVPKEEKCEENASTKGMTMCKEVELPGKIGNRLVSRQLNAPAKVIKTVFKGKESTTELTVGLKDIPLNALNNISVEKEKLSANHTKISICISKDKQAPRLQINNDIVKDIYFCEPTELLESTAKEKSSKTIITDIDYDDGYVEEDNDDEDYKSVASSVPSDSEFELKDTIFEKISHKKEMRLLNSVSKRRNSPDKKNDIDTKRNKQMSSIRKCNYKELEPLKTAITEMQVRMRNIRKDFFNSDEYYNRALKLARMSAGYCQSCGTRTVIPHDTFGYYKSMLPHKTWNHSQKYYINNNGTANSSFYSFRTERTEPSEAFGDSDINTTSSYLLRNAASTSFHRTTLKNSINDFPIFLGRV